MNVVILYGDGLHDDYPAIQEMLDSGKPCVYLPVPVNHYVIGKTLRIHSNQELRLDRYTRICLADNSNCCMLENAEPEEWNSNVTVTGGIWDMNHNRQNPNPYHFPDPETGKKWYDIEKEIGFDRNNRLFMNSYSGMCFRFNSIKGFCFRDLTIVNPVVYGMQMAYVEHFTIENICFEYNEGSPKLWNLDGVHIEGGCRNGVVRNLQGTCHDDLLAITSDDSIYGPIENISVDGLIADSCHSAVRLLSVKNPIRNIHITNIYGTYYVYCIILSKYYESDARSHFENITIDHVYASFSLGTKDVPGNYGPLIAVGDRLDIRKLSLSHIYRRESVCPTPLFGLGQDSTIGELYMEHVEQINETNSEMTLINNEGDIRKLVIQDVQTEDTLISGNEIEKIICFE